MFWVWVPRLHPLLRLWGPEGAEAAGMGMLGLGGLNWVRVEPHSMLVPKSRTPEAPANARPWCSSKAEPRADASPDVAFPGGSGCSASLPQPRFRKEPRSVNNSPPKKTRHGKSSTFLRFFFFFFFG